MIKRVNSYDTLRKIALKRDGDKCVQCGSPKQVIVHHLSYDLFSERDVPTKLLATLCTTCHARIPRRNCPSRGLLESKVDSITIRTPDLVNFTEASEMLGVSRPTIYNLIEKKKLHIVAFGRNRYLLRAEIERLKNAE